MKIFIDTANPLDIEKYYNLGLIDGVTTNPSLAAKENRPYKDTVKDILNIIKDLPISLETIATDYNNIIKEAVALKKLGNNVVVKIPCIQEGYKATKKLTDNGIKVNMTLCFTPIQAMYAAKVGATYISPFMGRLNDINKEGGEELLSKIKEIYTNYNFKTEILAASIRNLDNLENAALIGCDISTVPTKILEKMLNHKLTTQGLDKFLEDWNNTGLKLPV